ncbi:hypothetical protein LCGC14_2548800 [marine sediment metagenome]|uniref:Uncharacterized protein n=1 Tax=marine sediment metagenome TaxID=412755 RepID=A0A0F9DGL4_9ZZZZ
MYSKGDWKTEGNIIKVFGSGVIAKCPSPTTDDGVLEFIANAHLIAQAPRMYEWLKDLPLHCGCVYIDEEDATKPTFTIDTDYLELAKEIIK